MNREQFNALNDISDIVHGNAVAHGFYEDIDDAMDYLMVNDQIKYSVDARRNFVLAQLAKIASEVGECVAVIQKTVDWDELPEEMADILIRTLDLAGYLNMDIGNAVMLKVDKNANRPYKHGKYC